jgi:CRP-like cAMP-binding protein
VRAPRRDVSLEGDVRKLSGTRPFDLLPREALQLLAFSCEKRALKAGEKLFSDAEAADGAYFVLEGEIVLEGKAGERRVGPGALIGETSLMAEVWRGSAAKADREARVLEIPRETFLRVISEFPEAAAALRTRIAGRLATLLGALEAARARDFEV